MAKGLVLIASIVLFAGSLAPALAEPQRKPETSLERLDRRLPKLAKRPPREKLKAALEIGDNAIRAMDFEEAIEVFSAAAVLAENKGLKAEQHLADAKLAESLLRANAAAQALTPFKRLIAGAGPTSPLIEKVKALFIRYDSEWQEHCQELAASLPQGASLSADFCAPALPPTAAVPPEGAQAFVQAFMAQTMTKGAATPTVPKDLGDCTREQEGELLAFHLDGYVVIGRCTCKTRLVVRVEIPEFLCGEERSRLIFQMGYQSHWWKDLLGWRCKSVMTQFNTYTYDAEREEVKACPTPTPTPTTTSTPAPTSTPTPVPTPTETASSSTSDSSFSSSSDGSNPEPSSSPSSSLSSDGGDNPNSDVSSSEGESSHASWVTLNSVPLAYRDSARAAFQAAAAGSTKCVITSSFAETTNDYSLDPKKHEFKLIKSLAEVGRVVAKRIYCPDNVTIEDLKTERVVDSTTGS